MDLIDVHCHLTLVKGKERTIKEIENKMKLVVTSGIDINDGRKSLEIASRSEKIEVTLGFSPVNVKARSWDEFERFVIENKDSILGIGEVGLDYYWEKIPTKRELQKEFFAKSIGLAEELRMPLVIHTRDAFDDTVKILERNTPKQFFIHSFKYKWARAKQIIDLGGFVSLSTAIVRFKKDYTKLIKNVPLEYILTETDAPYLSPDKKANVPWNVEKSIYTIAGIKELDVEEVSNQICKNVEKVFDINV